ncbi:xanthine dehydrogenase family protein subunit M [Terriglobus albidus]|uniref:Xanthine dehydrogenase family protein subunit M n=1 Tax=Terriglobus albidus TaxID=1592106 RepID=A0A5B9E927_9BACT|nr:xanthine dehydrogenase family protein subunit M [Terriglobus albidus]QEE26787.1 xanthine dehydrogenase family protein subunit M [Terriglobus albidus]
MIDFELTRVGTPDAAIQIAAATPTAQQGATIRFIAGGTNLIDYMKLDVETPQHLVDINRIPDLAKVEKQSDGSLKIGALVRNSDLAQAPEVLAEYPVLSQALLSGASAQLRNKATTSGNLVQRTRCPYFRDLAYAECNKRTPGSGCAAIGGYHRNHAILGVSDQCIATHASDMDVALMVLDAVIHVQGAKGNRMIPIGEFYKLPGTTPHIENALEPGDLITHVTLPALPEKTKQIYLKLRDRASYEFALASAAIVMQVQTGRMRHVRVAMGGVGTRPWRMPEAERSLEGQAPTERAFRAAADAALRGARPHTDNAFKVELAKLCMIRALTTVTSA